MHITRLSWLARYKTVLFGMYWEFIIMEQQILSKFLVIIHI